MRRMRITEGQLEDMQKFSRGWKKEGDTYHNNAFTGVYWAIESLRGTYAIKFHNDLGSRFPKGFFPHCRFSDHIKKVDRESNLIYAKSIKSAKQLLMKWEIRRGFRPYTRDDFLKPEDFIRT